MQQQPQQMMPNMTSLPPNTITTEQIQKCLDENKKLILAILDNQNLGKLAECAQYQTQLQKNLMYLAAIADAQPQPQPQAPAMPAQQLAPHPAMQQAGYYMQHPQAAAAMAQQQGLFPQKMQMQFNSPQQMHEMQQQLHQQAMHGQMGMRPGGANGMPSMHHTENTHGGSKQDNSEAGAGGDGQGNSAGGHRSGDGEDK
ncbi:PREDICTED: GRF1-interacting factor 3-like isoform X1 [Fragaria vesca subsp. vesca]|uniref:GRF1-interacting factor 3-like isoform X1 n=1 Tax=Fragaria vesca subsp. vesca TaxID=101020 RepID=UPI0001AC0835|nr:PREDICTED: GRF1-interacting factor 3-like isoform X1 [Fragaria vesca subsp. vesca]